MALEPSFVAALKEMVEALRSADLDAITASVREVGLPVGEDADYLTLLRLVGVLLGGDEVGEADLGDFGRSLGAIRAVSTPTIWIQVPMTVSSLPFLSSGA